MAVTQPSGTTDNAVVDAPDEQPVERSVADIRRDGLARHTAWIAELKGDIALGGEKGQRATRTLLATLESDVRSLTEQRDRAEAERDRARDQESDTFTKAMEAWKGWAASETARGVLQRKVDRREWISWPHILIIVAIIAGTAYTVAGVLVGA